MNHGPRGRRRRVGDPDVPSQKEEADDLVSDLRVSPRERSRITGRLTSASPGRLRLCTRRHRSIEEATGSSLRMDTSTDGIAPPGGRPRRYLVPQLLGGTSTASAPGGVRQEGGAPHRREHPAGPWSRSQDPQTARHDHCARQRQVTVHSSPAAITPDPHHLVKPAVYRTQPASEAARSVK